jgi:hypothetical protein
MNQGGGKRRASADSLPKLLDQGSDAKKPREYVRPLKQMLGQ